MAWDQHSSMTVTQLLWTVNQKKLDNDNFDWHSHRYQNQYLYLHFAVLLSNSMLQNSHFYVKYMFNIFFIMTLDIFSSQYLFTWQSLQVRSGVRLREAAGGQAPCVGGHQQLENIEAKLHPVPWLHSVSVHGWVSHCHWLLYCTVLYCTVLYCTAGLSQCHWLVVTTTGRYVQSMMQGFRRSLLQSHISHHIWSED